METLEQRVAQNTDAADCEACGERIAQCLCDEPWQGPFKFCQLGDRAQEKAIEDEQRSNSEHFDPLDCIGCDVAIINNLGFEIGMEYRTSAAGKRYEFLNIAYSLGHSGEYVAFPCNWSAERLNTNIVLAEAPQDKDLPSICLRLATLRMQYPTSEAKITCNSGSRDPTMDGEFYPEGSSAWSLDDAVDGHEVDETITDIARDVAGWLLEIMRSNYEDCYDRDRCIEQLTERESSFDEDGELQ